jgi:hypothetical protein
MKLLFWIFSRGLIINCTPFGWVRFLDYRILLSSNICFNTFSDIWRLFEIESFTRKLVEIYGFFFIEKFPKFSLTITCDIKRNFFLAIFLADFTDSILFNVVFLSNKKIWFMESKSFLSICKVYWHFEVNFKHLLARRLRNWRDCENIWFEFINYWVIESLNESTREITE